MITDPFFTCWRSPHLLIGIAKGGLGGGIGILGVPLMALAIGPRAGSGNLLPILMLMDAFAVRQWWGRWDPSQSPG